jgi:hypothetical protein
MSGPEREKKKRKRTEVPVIGQEPYLPRKKKPRTWEESFRALVAYKEKHGSCNVPRSFKQDVALAHWVSNQWNRRLTKLTQEQHDKLDEMAFDWETRQEREEREWDEKFQKLREYRRQHLDCCVPRDYKQDPELGPWVSHQRTMRSQDIMSHDRMTKLEFIGFTWSKTQSNPNTSNRDEKWFEKYSKLADFSKEHGHCMVPISYKKDKSLGIWVTNQRSYHAREILRQDRKELLDKLGFVWRVDKADADASLTQRKWDQMLERLVEFKQTNGRANVPRSFKKWGLGRWVSDQRNDGRKGEMDPRRAPRLLAIGLDFDPRWKENFERLEAYKKKNGHCNVSATGANVEDAKLLGWVKNQRSFRENGFLLPKRNTQLDEIGFVWQASHFGDARESEENSVAAVEHVDMQRAALDDDVPNVGEGYGNGLEESDGSDEEFEFQG